MSTTCRFLFTAIFTFLFCSKIFCQRDMLIVNIFESELDITTMMMSDDDAHTFDVAAFLTENADKKMLINGSFYSIKEVVEFYFNNQKDTAIPACPQYCQEIVSIEKKPYLGAAIRDTENFSGVEVTGIIEGSAAAEAGFEVGDLITFVNDDPIYELCDLQIALAQYEPGDAMDIEIIRSDRKEKLYTILGYRLKKNVSWRPCCELEMTAAAAPVETSHISVEVFPNPSDGLFQVKYASSTEKPLEVFLTDMNGRIFFQKDIKNFRQFYHDHIDLTHHAAGMYFINFVQDGKIKTEKVILVEL